MKREGIKEFNIGGYYNGWKDSEILKLDKIYERLQ